MSVAVNRPDERLALCAEFVREGVAVADIGTDHAYLPLWLVASGKAKSVVASDLREGPLARAAANVKKYGADSRISLRLGNGLENISATEADDVVIAGMGGEVIASIIDNCDWVKSSDKRLILQPMTKCEELVGYLLQNGFEILNQRCCRAGGKLYTVVRCAYNGETKELIETDKYFGKLDLNDADSLDFFDRQLDKLRLQRRFEPKLDLVVAELEKIRSERVVQISGKG